MLVYLDSSAIIKRFVEEAESDALDAELARGVENGCVLVTSSLGSIEVTRAIRSRAEREHPARIAELVELALSGVAESPIDESVVSLARRIGPRSVRSLDAIHLATAIILDVDVLIAYDERLLMAAGEMGLSTLRPSPDFH